MASYRCDSSKTRRTRPCEPANQARFASKIPEPAPNSSAPQDEPPLNPCHFLVAPPQKSPTFCPRHSDLSCLAYSTDESIVHLHKPLEPVATVSHNLAQIPQHSIEARPKHPYHLGKPLRQNPGLASAHQVERCKPFGQRQTRRLENRIGLRRIFTTAFGALVQMTMFQLVGLVVTALRADESVFPAMLVQLFQTSLLSGILLCPVKKIV